MSSDIVEYSVRDVEAVAIRQESLIRLFIRKLDPWRPQYLDRSRVVLGNIRLAIY